jgi:hypothetical protein
MKSWGCQAVVDQWTEFMLVGTHVLFISFQCTKVRYVALISCSNAFVFCHTSVLTLFSLHVVALLPLVSSQGKKGIPL